MKNMKNMKKVLELLKICFYHIPSILKIYITWMLLHYISVILYNRWCVPKSWYDVLFTPVIFHTPQCKILQWVFTTSTSSINEIIIIITTSAICYITRVSSIENYKITKK